MLPDEITWAMITAPRTADTYQRCIDSLRLCGVSETLHVFAEPGSFVENEQGLIVERNAERRGCFRNYAHALESIYDKKKYCCILSDDFVFASGLIPTIEKIQDFDWGFCSLYTIKNYDVHISKPGWHNIAGGWYSYGGNYIMQRDIVAKVIVSEEYIAHRDHYEKNQQIDAFFGKWYADHGYSTWYHNPSLSEHFGGAVSTLGHTHSVPALNFKLWQKK